MQFPGLVQRLTDMLREKIITGELLPGQNINEIELAKGFNISRSPLREALKALESERLVFNVPRKGSYVSEISIEDLSEVYQMRVMIECYAIDLLEEKGIQTYDDLVHRVDRMKELEMPSEDSSPRDKLNYIESLAEFHLELVKAAGNKRLFEFYQSIHSNINRYVFLHSFTEGVAEHRVDEHFNAIDCIQNRKYQKAKDIIKKHIRKSYEDIKKRIDS